MGAYKDRNGKSRDTAVKALRAMEMRAAGSGWQEIADAVGYRNGASAYNLVNRTMEKIPVEGTRELRLVQHERYMLLLAPVWAKATNPDHPEHLKAVDRARAILADVTSLFGLDHPSIDETDDAREAGPLVSSLTREEYYAALDAIADVHVRRQQQEMAAEDAARVKVLPALDPPSA